MTMQTIKPCAGRTGAKAVRLLVEDRDAKVLKSWSKKICGAIQEQIGI